MAQFSIHKGTPKIYLNTPSDIVISNNTTSQIKQIKVTIPADTYMSLDEGTYSYNYCAFVQVKIKNNEDKVIETVPNLSSDFLKKLTKQSAEADYNVVSEFKDKLAPYVFLFRVGQDTEAGWSSNPTLSNAFEKTFDITDSTAYSYEVAVCGVTVNTATWNDAPNYGSDSLRYSNYSWVTTDRNTDTDVLDEDKSKYVPGGGGNACPCPAHAVSVDATSLFGPISPGKVTAITDNGNETITIKGVLPTDGTNNPVTSSKLTVVFKNATLDGSQVGSTVKKILIGSSGSTNDGKAFEGSTGITITIPDGALLAEVDLSSEGKVGTLGGFIVLTSGNISFGKPNPPTKLSYSSTGGKFRLKDNLTWTWSGATNGHNARVDGYRIFIYKNGDTNTADKNYAIKNPIKLDTSIGETAAGTPYVEKAITSTNYATDPKEASLTFNPKDDVIGTTDATKFKSGDRCYCRVFSYAKWGENIHYSEKSLLGVVKSAGTNNDTIIYITGTPCTLKNAATVWVRVDTNGDGTPDTWKEGTVYVYHNNKWKEAEGVYVHDGSKWKEST